jgi:hypothetical protein
MEEKKVDCDKIRFEVELDFIQSLSNPFYLHCLINIFF